MRASPVDIAIAVLVSPLVLILFVVTLVRHGLRIWR